MTEYVIGQVLKDKRNKPNAVFMVLDVWEKTYPNGDVATRVHGIVASGGEFRGSEVGERELDSRSLLAMFPYTLFLPRQERDNECK